MKKVRKSLIAVLTAIVSIGCAAQTAAPVSKATAIFAGGCFWCMESDFEKLPGVIQAESGYIGGTVVNPTYKQVSAGKTGHTEAIRITYDSKAVNYRQLLDHFWVNIDPTVANRQFCDIGSQYRSGIYYLNEQQKAAALISKQALQASGRLSHAVENSGKPVEIHTEIAPAGTFYVAEEYHQDYYKKNPFRYKFYRSRCGRDARLKYLWKK